MKAKQKPPETQVPCTACRAVNVFKQPYPYHAGFGNQGFLYNDAGTLTLVWGSYDPAYVAIVGQNHPWALTLALRSKLEESLLPAPAGGRWRFSNPPRCRFCGHAIGAPIGDNIYFLEYDNSIDAESGLGLAQYLHATTHAT
jgi:hypothetical protein